jgi:HNH endonuclease
MMHIANKEGLITAEWLRSVLQYNQETGIFTWLVAAGGVCIGSPIKTLNSNGYVVVGLNGKKYRQHRLAWLYVYGCWPDQTIDHKDGDRANNRIDNLRVLPQSINVQNRRTASKNSTSGVLGVYFSARRNGYMASVTTNGHQKRKGPYKSIDRAHQAYLEIKRVKHEGCTL